MPVTENQPAACSSHGCGSVAVFHGPYGRGWCLRHQDEYTLLMLGKQLGYPELEVDPHRNFILPAEYFFWFRWCSESANQWRARLKETIAFAEKRLPQV